MHEFLSGICEAYVHDPDIASYTFVFPNLRSMRYFEECLKKRMRGQSVNVDTLCITMPELVEKGCGMHMASVERLLFILYRAYCNVRGENNVESFGRFRFWGQMLLKDFNDVDRYLADPKELFRNSKDYKKIQSFYLTPQQEEIIRTYWGNDPYWRSALTHRDEASDLPFWNHISMKGEPERKFTQLWAILGELYNEFHLLLAKTDECYPGMAYRRVAEQLLNGQRLRYNPKLYVFIGFSRLSHSEHAIFQQLNNQGLAHFYWDYNPVLMNHKEANTAGRFLRTYVEEFKTSKPDVNTGTPLLRHDVEVIAVPSNIAQTKVAAELLTDDDTALVLADCELLVPMVASVPERYDHVNVTMGFPMRFTTLSQLFTLLTTMQLRARIDSTGEAIFFHDDVVSLTLHPAVQKAFSRECEELISNMRRNHLYNLPQSALVGNTAKLSPLFQTIGKEATPQKIEKHIITLLQFMVESGMLGEIDKICLSDLTKTIERIISWAVEYDIKLDRKTLYEMIERTIHDRTLALEGESFDAMQVMGVLETRGLSFSNVVMLSMNDSIYPGSDSTYSFIPETLRRAYGLPTRDHMEADSAYHFYRILSHARRLTLLYDARTSGLRNGQPSRYITQLIYGKFPGVNLIQYDGEFTAPIIQREPMIGFDYQTDKRVFADTLDKFSKGEYIETHRLSASDLKEYINCPLQFFLTKINDINPPETEKEESGAAEHGNVIHTVAQHVYNFFKERNAPVTREDLELLVSGGFDNLLERELVRAINIHFLHYPERVDGKENLQLYNIPLDEKNSLYADAIRLSLAAMFKKEQTPFTILGTEVPVKFTWNVSPGVTVNFKMIIDRLDSIVEGNNTIHRIIDYKTGKDETSFASVESLFEIGNSKTQRKAIFQLLLYCAAYLETHTELRADQIRPMIFKLKEVKETEFGCLKFGNSELTDYGVVKGAFEESMIKMFTEIFDISTPIVRTTDTECCKFCPFKQMCN